MGERNSHPRHHVMDVLSFRRPECAPPALEFCSVHMYNDIPSTGMSSEPAEFYQLREDTARTTPNQVPDEDDDGMQYWKLEQLSKTAVEQFKSIRRQEEFEVRVASVQDMASLICRRVVNA